MSELMTTSRAPQVSMLRIVRGAPSDEELAGLIAALTTLANAATAQPTAPRSAWADPAHQLRPPLHPGPGGWRYSALPHSGVSGGPASSGP